MLWKTENKRLKIFAQALMEPGRIWACPEIEIPETEITVAENKNLITT